MSLNSTKIALPGSICHELHCAVSLKYLNKVNFSSKMKVKHHVDLMFDLFYRCSRKEIVSGIDLLLQREDPYLRMFDEKE